jgi:predicted glycogen debranching enzyme
MNINFGREICGNLEIADKREWLVTNGIGGYASGTIANVLTRRYHGLLIAALNPPLGRTLLLAKLEEIIGCANKFYPLSSNRWADGSVSPEGHKYIESFHLEGTMPVWRFAVADGILEKRIWMQRGSNTTYIRYHLHRANKPITIAIKALVNYRDYHHNTQANPWSRFNIDTVEGGVRVTAFPEAAPLYLLVSNSVKQNGLVVATPSHEWYYRFHLEMEQYRGLNDREDHLLAVTFHARIEPGRSLTLIATTEENANLDSDSVLESHRASELQLIQQTPSAADTPDWIKQLVLAANQFIVDRPSADEPQGKSIIAGYHWFGDWGRDTMISLPGLTLATGRPEIARSILRTFSRYVDRGMLPNRFPDEGDTPDYNTVDATLWYFEAVRAYHDATDDDGLLAELFPVLAEIVDWHRRGTRYNIQLDADDGLIYAGEPDSQLTWMDVKIDDWTVTPRAGKPIEISALWYNALQAMVQFARVLGKSSQEYEELAGLTAKGFDRFWNDELGYCYDVLDTPNGGSDDSLRPNQIFPVSLPPMEGKYSYSPLLSSERQRRVVDVCGEALLTSYGLRSLAPDDPEYKGIYGGDRLQRDGSYHQGTVWGWLIGPFALAHLRVYGDRATARELLAPMSHHLLDAGVGSLSEVFDGDAPMRPRGCIAQAWTVAEVLRAWFLIWD